jgi:phosphoribosyl 1,2-cyclic phosphodiesterase
LLGLADARVAANDPTLPLYTQAIDGAIKVDAAVAKDMAHVPISSSIGSLERMASLDARKIYTHINNTNPILDENSEERRMALAAGWEVAVDGMEITP